MRPTTRLRILEFLRKQQAGSVREMSRSLGMTGANIRHHLAVLESNELIEVIGLRREGRGRPVNLYRLSRRVLGDGMDSLASAMLEEWFQVAPKNRQVGMLQSLAQHLASDGNREAAIPLTRRLAETVEHLNQLHYQSRWEAGAAGPRLILGHCPYSAIIERHPELCRMDALMLTERLGMGVQQTAKLEKNIQGLPHCAFRVLEEQATSPG